MGRQRARRRTTAVRLQGPIVMPRPQPAPYRTEMPAQVTHASRQVAQGMPVRCFIDQVARVMRQQRVVTERLSTGQRLGWRSPGRVAASALLAYQFPCSELPGRFQHCAVHCRRVLPVECDLDRRGGHGNGGRGPPARSLPTGRLASRRHLRSDKAMPMQQQQQGRAWTSRSGQGHADQGAANNALLPGDGVDDLQGGSVRRQGQIYRKRPIRLSTVRLPPVRRDSVDSSDLKSGRRHGPCEGDDPYPERGRQARRTPPPTSRQITEPSTRRSINTRRRGLRPRRTGWRPGSTSG